MGWLFSSAFGIPLGLSAMALAQSTAPSAGTPVSDSARIVTSGLALPASIGTSPSAQPSAVPAPSGALPAHASAAPSASSAEPVSRPFGPGFPVEVTSDKPWVYAYVARGVVDTRSSFPDPFKKVGRLPLTFELPPGVYTVLVEGEFVTPGSAVFEIKDRPAKIAVRGGSQSLRDLSSYVFAAGGAALLAGVVFELSRSQDESSKQKNSVVIPLLIVGGVGLVSGLTFVLVSGTTVESTGFVAPQTRRPPSSALVLFGRF